MCNVPISYGYLWLQDKMKTLIVHVSYNKNIAHRGVDV
jgi:hypothetical protein